MLLLSEEKIVLFKFDNTPPLLSLSGEKSFVKSYEGMGLGPRNIHSLLGDFRYFSRDFI